MKRGNLVKLWCLVISKKLKERKLFFKCGSVCKGESGLDLNYRLLAFFSFEKEHYSTDKRKTLFCLPSLAWLIQVNVSQTGLLLVTIYPDPTCSLIPAEALSHPTSAWVSFQMHQPLSIPFSSKAALSLMLNISLISCLITFNYGKVLLIFSILWLTSFFLSFWFPFISSKNFDFFSFLDEDIWDTGKCYDAFGNITN